MEPREVAELVMDKVVNYCLHEPGDTLECLAGHNPDELDKFVYSFLPEKEAEELKKVIANSGTFWDEVKKEYEELWNEEMGIQLDNALSNELHILHEEIAITDMLSDSTKVRLLKAYEKVLGEFSDAVWRALQERKPLSGKDLYYWFKKMGDTVYEGENYYYYDEIDHYIGYYDMLSNNEKLKALDGLLESLDSVFHHIESTLRDLGALTNKS